MSEKKTEVKEEVIDKKKRQLERIEEISQKVFGKPSSEIKFLLCTNYIHQQLLDEDVTRTGLYQWLNVFNGDIKYPRDVLDYSEYDIIQLNMSPQDLPLIHRVRKELGENSKTKLIINNDFTEELWGTSYEFPEVLEALLQNADMIFGTEYNQVTGLSELAQRRVYVVPHPADTKRLKAMSPIPKKDIISTIWRRYDRFSYVPSLVVRNHGLTTQLIGYDKDKDPKVYMTTALFDYVLAGTNYFEFCDQLRESKVVYDPFTFTSYSRTTVDTAALGIPVVGTDRTQSMQICYPYTCVSPYDVAKARQLIEKVLNDKEFHDLVVDTAKRNCEFYNHANSKERYLVALNDSIYGKKDETITKKKKVLTKGVGDDVLSLQQRAINRPPSNKNGKKKN